MADEQEEHDGGPVEEGEGAGGANAPFQAAAAAGISDAAEPPLEEARSAAEGVEGVEVEAANAPPAAEEEQEEPARPPEEPPAAAAAPERDEEGGGAGWGRSATPPQQDQVAAEHFRGAEQRAEHGLRINVPHDDHPRTPLAAMRAYRDFDLAETMSPATRLLVDRLAEGAAPEAGAAGPPPPPSPVPRAPRASLPPATPGQ